MSAGHPKDLPLPCPAVPGSEGACSFFVFSVLKSYHVLVVCVDKNSRTFAQMIRSKTSPLQPNLGRGVELLILFRALLCSKLYTLSGCRAFRGYSFAATLFSVGGPAFGSLGSMMKLSYDVI